MRDTKGARGTCIRDVYKGRRWENYILTNWRKEEQGDPGAAWKGGRGTQDEQGETHGEIKRTGGKEWVQVAFHSHVIYHPLVDRRVQLAMLKGECLRCIWNLYVYFSGWPISEAAGIRPPHPSSPKRRENSNMLREKGR